MGVASGVHRRKIVRRRNQCFPHIDDEPRGQDGLHDALESKAYFNEGSKREKVLLTGRRSQNTRTANISSFSIRHKPESDSTHPAIALHLQENRVRDAYRCVHIKYYDEKKRKKTTLTHRTAQRSTSFLCAAEFQLREAERIQSIIGRRTIPIYS